MTAIMLGVALAAGAFSAGVPAHAQSFAPQPSPLVRIQLVIERVHVLDDSDDLTSGELTYRFRLQRGADSCPGIWCEGAGELFISSVSISADTGDVRNVNRVLGGPNGLALYSGDRMRISFAGVEEDWDGLPSFCPVRSATRFDDTMCAAHDRPVPDAGVAPDADAAPR